MKNFFKESWFKIIIASGILLTGALFFYSYTLKPFFSNIVFQTVFSGTLVFVFGQIIQNLFTEYYRYREIIRKIDNRLKFYFNIIKNPGKSAHPIDRLQYCSQELRQLSCDLESYRKQLIFRCKKKTDKNVSEASRLLIELHFNVFTESKSEENIKNLEEIRKLLNIPKLSE